MHISTVIFLTLLLAQPPLTAASPPGDRNEWVVGHIDFVGNNSLSREEILRQMELRPRRLLQRSVFSFSVLLDDIASINELYVNRGFLDVDVRIDTLVYRDERGLIDIRIAIEEGPLTTIDSIEITSHILSDEKLRRSITVQPGSPLENRILEQSRFAILDTLRNRGHLFASVDYRYSLRTERAQAALTFDITEGPVVLAGDWDVLGLERTNEIAVTREMVFDSGDVVTPVGVARSTRRLYGTGLFTSVRIEPQDTALFLDRLDTAAFPVLIEIQEANPLDVTLAAGLEFGEEYFADVGLGYRNLFGLGQSVSLTTRVSNQFLGLRLSYAYPWLFSTPFLLNSSAFLQRQEREYFDAVLYGIRTTLSRRVGYLTQLRAWAEIENADQLDEPPPTLRFPPYPRTLIVAQGVGVDWDTRADVIEPLIGISTYLDFEIAGLGIAAGARYYQLRGAARILYPQLPAGIRILSSVVGGMGDGYAQERGILPPQRRFVAGAGAIPVVRGYDREEISPVDENGNLRGGRYALVLTPFEGTIPLFWIVGAALFVDAGHVWANAADISWRDLQWSYGPGLRVQLANAVFRFDYGFKIGGERLFDGKFHFDLSVPL